MDKQKQSFSINNFEKIQGFMEKQIDSTYDTIFNCKSILAFAPLITSIFYTLANNSYNVQLKTYIEHNLTSFSNKQTQIEELKTSSLLFFIYDDLFNEKQSLNIYQLSQLVNFELLNPLVEKKQIQNFQFNPTKTPFFISSKFSTIKKRPSTDLEAISRKKNDLINLDELENLSQIRNLNYYSYNKKANYFSLIQQLSVAQLNNLQTTSVYYFLKREHLFKRYQFQKSDQFDQNLRLMSKYPNLNLFQDFSNSQTKNSNLQFPGIVENLTQCKNNNDSIKKFFVFPSKKTIPSNIKVSVPGQKMDFSFILHPFMNDIIINNPNILQNILSSLKVQNEMNDTSLDLFNGSVKKRIKYRSSFPNFDENPFIKDLKNEYNLLSSLKSDQQILKLNKSDLSPKYSTIVRVTQNRIGDQFDNSIYNQIADRVMNIEFSKIEIEVKFKPEILGKTNASFRSNGENSDSVMIDFPLHWENLNVVKDANSLFEDKNLQKINNEKFLFDKKTYRISNRKYNPIKINYFQYCPTIFSYRWDTPFIVNSYQYLNGANWLSLTQLSISFFLIYLITQLYKVYQYELGLYLSEFVSQLDLYDEDIKNLIDQVQKNGSLRIVRTLNVSFLDLGGMIDLLPKFGETVWYLKNKCRPSQKSNLIPKAILLVGPPGTGKTLLVKAIGVEADVPVLIQSGNDIIEENNGIGKLQEAFQKARELSPCILFIDEMDSIGSARSELELSLNQNNNSMANHLTLRLDHLKRNQEKNSLKTSKNHNFSQQKNTNDSPQKINALTQLLVEMDGVEKRRGFVVFGATNRHESLDPALIRPGRFNEIIEIGLPNQQKRIEILKIYTKKLGFNNSLNWDSFGKKTVGLSAADLATLVNRSAIQSILHNTKHTEYSLLKGYKEIQNTGQTFPIDSIYHSKFTKKTLVSLAYYEFGRHLTTTKLLNLFCNLNQSDNLSSKNTPEIHSFIESVLLQESNVNLKNNIELFRSFEISDREQVVQILMQKIQTFNPKIKDLILWLLIQLSGKASEFLYVLSKQTDRSRLITQMINSKDLYTNFITINELTTIGEIDLFKANLLAEYYTKTVAKVQNQNDYCFNLFSSFEKISPSSKNSHPLISRTINSEDSNLHISRLRIQNQINDFQNKQLWNSESEWLNILGKTMKNPSWRKWFRVHLANPEVSIFNEEILFTDCFQLNFKKSTLNAQLSNQLSWDTIVQLCYDFEIQNILMLAFEYNFIFLDDSRQKLDQLVFSLIDSYCLTEKSSTENQIQ